MELELLILPGAAQVCGVQVPLPARLHGLFVLEAHQSHGDFCVPRRAAAVLRTPEVDFLAARHHHGEVLDPALVLHAVHLAHALE